MGNNKPKLSMGAGVDSRDRIEFGGIEFFLYFISYLHCDCGYTTHFFFFKFSELFSVRVDFVICKLYVQ